MINTYRKGIINNIKNFVNFKAMSINKVKHFSANTQLMDNYGYRSLEDKINEFLSEENIHFVDIKYSSTINSSANSGNTNIQGVTEYSALLIYILITY